MKVSADNNWLILLAIVGMVAAVATASVSIIFMSESTAKLSGGASFARASPSGGAEPADVGPNAYAQSELRTG